MPNRRLALLAIPVIIGLTACGGSSGKASSNDPSTKATAPAAAVKPSDTLTITSPAGSVNTGFKEKSLSAPANTPLKINFRNDDPGIPHNIQVFKGAKASDTPVFTPTGAGVMVTGPGTFAYDVPALQAGTYTLNCAIHPTTMVAALTVA